MRTNPNAIEIFPEPPVASGRSFVFADGAMMCVQHRPVRRGLCKARLLSLVFQFKMLLGCGALILALGNFASGQLLDTQDRDNLTHSARFVHDRALISQLTDVRADIENRRYASAINSLQQIMNAKRESFVEDGGVMITTRLLAERLLATLPSAEIDRYRQQWGKIAQREFVSAQHAGDAARLAEIAAKFRHTPAGLQALQFLAAQHYDHGRYHAAAVTSQAVASHPLADSQLVTTALARQCLALCNRQEFEWAENILSQLLRGHAEQTVADQSLKLKQLVNEHRRRFSNRRPNAASQDNSPGFAVTSGTLNGNPLTTATVPSLSPLWSRPTSVRDDLATLIESGEREIAEYGVSSLPCTLPVVVGDVAIVKTIDQLLAFDTISGEILWHKPAGIRAGGDDPASHFVRDSAFHDLVEETVTRQLQASTSLGTISANDHSVFSVESLPVVSTALPSAEPFGARSNEGPRNVENQLVAYDLLSGEEQWRIGGESISARDQFSGTTFLGPPLVVDNSLFVLIQQDAELKLLVLDAPDARLGWSARLAEVHEELSGDAQRRHTACAVAIEGDTIVCATAAGALIAVDLTTRTIRWAYRYERDDRGNESVPGAARFNRRNRYRWFDAWRGVSLVLADGRIYLASPESENLHALDLSTGRLLWRRKRDAGLFLAGAIDQRLLLVDKYGVHSIEGATGETAWTSFIGAPAGRGYLNESSYFQPLAVGSIAQLDLTDGATRIVETAEATQLGNLLATQHGVVSVTPNSVRLLPYLQQARATATLRLQQQPDDVQAQLAHAVLDRQAGAYQSATAALTELLASTEGEQSRFLLIETLFAELRQHPQRAGRISTDISPLIDSNAQQIRWLREFAIAKTRVNDRLTALRAYLKLLDSTSRQYIEVNNGPSRRVRYDRYLQGQIADLFINATPAEIDQFDAEITKTFAQAQASRDPFAIQRFAARFGQLKWGRNTRTTLARESAIGVDFPQLQLQLLELAGTGDRQIAGRALLRLAEHLNARSYRDDAAVYYRRLLDEFAEVPIVEQKTAVELAADLPEDSLLALAIANGPREKWALAQVKVTVEDRRNRRPEHYPVPVEAARGSLFDRISVTIDRQSKSVRFQGGGHRGSWELPLPESKSPFRLHAFHLHKGWGLGHLLILRVGTELFGITPLDDNGDAHARLQWTLDTRDETKWDGNGHDVRRARLGFGVDEYVFLDKYSRPIAQVGPVRAGILCFQQKGQLVAIDPATGHELWRRHDVPLDCTVSGDDEYLVLSSWSGAEAQILRTVDGKLVESRPATTSPTEILNWHGTVRLTETQLPTSYDISAVMATTAQTRWHRSFAIGSVPFAIDHDRFGVIDPNTGMQFVSVRTGETINHIPIELRQTIEQLYTFTDPFRIFVMVSTPTKAPAAVQRRRTPTDFRIPKVNGILYACDRQTGRLIWQRELRDSSLLLDQSRDSPLLLARVNLPIDNGIAKYRTLCLDRRNGRLLHSFDGAEEWSNLLVETNIDAGRVDLQTPTQTIRFDITGN